MSRKVSHGSAESDAVNAACPGILLFQGILFHTSIRQNANGGRSVAGERLCGIGGCHGLVLRGVTEVPGWDLNTASAHPSGILRVFT